jgi:hypothetical protein
MQGMCRGILKQEFDDMVFRERGFYQPLHQIQKGKASPQDFKYYSKTHYEIDCWIIIHGLPWLNTFIGKEQVKPTFTPPKPVMRLISCSAVKELDGHEWIALFFGRVRATAGYDQEILHDILCVA